MSMNRIRYDAIVASQTNIARKVLEFIPIQEFWDVKAIATEMYRQTASSTDKNIIEGCLSALHESGLIVAKKGRFFCRVMPREESLRPQTLAAIAAIPNRSPSPMPKPAAAKPSPLDRMAGIATDLRTIANKLDELAIEVMQSVEATSTQSQRLVELKSLLRDLVE